MMKSIVIFSLLFFKVEAFNKEGHDKQQREHFTPAISTRVVRGDFAQHNQFKFIAHLSLEFNNGGSAHGSGTLIAPTWVITAAHVLYPMRSATVFLGTIDLHTAPFQYKAERRNMIFHHAYNDENLNNDIALIRLGTVPRSSAIVPLALPGVRFNLPFGASAFTMGWGRTSTHGNLSDTLKYAMVRVISNENCIRQWPDLLVTEVCTTGITGSFCGGDSGGPLVSLPEYVLVGVISYGQLECDGVNPDVYTRITSYLGWIQNYTGIRT